jgi:hypothetical protein
MNLYVAVGQAPSVPIGREIIISNFQYAPYGGQIGFSRTADTTPFLSSVYSVPISSTSSACTATVESDSPWITVLGPNPIPAGATLQYSVPDNIGVTRTGNLILQSTNCGAALGNQILSVTQAGFVCSPTFETDSDHIGFLQSVRSVLIRGSASECSWTVTSSSPWLSIITSSASGAGDGSIQFTANGNSDPALRQGLLSLDDGQQHWVYQDGAGALFGLSPLVASPCGNQVPQFGASWIAQSNVEIHLGSSGGQLVGQFAQSGTALLPKINRVPRPASRGRRGCGPAGIAP